jgi:hypothetical protein
MAITKNERYGVTDIKPWEKLFIKESWGIILYKYHLKL